MSVSSGARVREKAKFSARALLLLIAVSDEALVSRLQQKGSNKTSLLMLF
jgi:hypothetical protein